MRAAVLAVALLLAGCAGDAAPPPPGPEDYPPAGSATPPPPWYGEEQNATLLLANYALDPAASVWEQPVRIPNGTAQVLVTFTLNGAAVAFSLDLAGCRFEVPGPVPGDGRELTKDCGGLYEGDETLRLAIGSGKLDGSVRVDARLCAQPGAGCYRFP